MSVDYKIKYLDLRSKFMKTTERFYRLGKEDGLKEGALQAQQQQAQMMAQQAQMMQPQIDPQTGQPMPPEMQGQDMGQDMGQDGQMPPEMQGQDMGQDMSQLTPEEQSELDSKIDELQQLVSKGEKPKVTDLRKAVNAIYDLRKSQKQLKSNHKAVVNTKQKDLVNNILKKWEEEANDNKLLDNLEKIIETEGIKL